MRARLCRAGLAAATFFLAGACDPVPPPRATPLAGLVPASTRPCLAPPMPGEPDPALRDLRLTVTNGTATLQGCVVSQRFDGFESLSLQAAVLSDTGEVGRYVRLGTGGTDIRAVRGMPADGPRVMVLLSVQADKLPSGFGTRASDMLAVRLGWRGCTNDAAGRCIPEPRETTQSIVPAIVIHSDR